MSKRNLHKSIYEEFENWRNILNKPEYFKPEKFMDDSDKLIELDFLPDDCDCDMCCDECYCAVDDDAVKTAEYVDETWTLVDKVYNLTVGVPCGKSDTTVELVDGKRVSITYSSTHNEEGPHYKYSYTTTGKIEKTLPSDGDINTLRAKYDSNFLTISIAKKGFVEPILNRVVDVE